MPLPGPVPNVSQMTPEVRRGHIVTRLANLGVQQPVEAPHNYNFNALTNTLNAISEEIFALNDRMHGSQDWLTYLQLLRTYRIAREQQGDPNHQIVLAARDAVVNQFYNGLEHEYVLARQLDDRLSKIIIELAPTLLLFPLNHLVDQTQVVALQALLLIKWYLMVFQNAIALNTNPPQPFVEAEI